MEIGQLIHDHFNGRVWTWKQGLHSSAQWRRVRSISLRWSHPQDDYRGVWYWWQERHWPAEQIYHLPTDILARRSVNRAGSWTPPSNASWAFHTRHRLLHPRHIFCVLECTAKPAMFCPHLNRQSFARILLLKGFSEISYQLPRKNWEHLSQWALSLYFLGLVISSLGITHFSRLLNRFSGGFLAYCAWLSPIAIIMMAYGINKWSSTWLIVLVWATGFMYIFVLLFLFWFFEWNRRREIRSKASGHSSSLRFEALKSTYFSHC